MSHGEGIIHPVCICVSLNAHTSTHNCTFYRQSVAICYATNILTSFDFNFPSQVKRGTFTLPHFLLLPCSLLKSSSIIYALRLSVSLSAVWSVSESTSDCTNKTGFCVESGAESSELHIRKWLHWHNRSLILQVLQSVHHSSLKVLHISEQKLASCGCSAESGSLI